MCPLVEYCRFQLQLMGSATAGESESCALLDKYFDFGGNFIDTANMYSAGQAEEIIGAWMNK